MKIDLVIRRSIRRLLKLPDREAASAAETSARPATYPVQVPEIEIRPNLDFLLLELPSRYMPMMPSGLGYVHNILVKSGVVFQTVDANIVLYHSYHSRRIRDGINIDVRLRGVSEDPWDNTNAPDWHREEVVDYFWPFMEEIVTRVVRNPPKAVGISLNGNNRTVARRFVAQLRSKLPRTIIVVGGYDCVYEDVGPSLFPDFDYMVIGESELTLRPLVTALARGERPGDLPGIISRYDSPVLSRPETPLLQDLDSAGFPRYEWTDLALYQTYLGEHLVPISSSRGCRWGRCRFCAECFPFRHRSPGHVADEISFMVGKGFDTFHFNESDVNGDTQALYDLCSHIIERGLSVKFVGQLRIDRHSTAEYFLHLAKAGFKLLRFGVDGWSDRVLALQNKGYTMSMVFQNLHDCHAAGIFTSVNMVIGVPGETEADVDEMIHNVLACGEMIDMVDNVNTLHLLAGSEYYRRPDRYKIRFRSDRNKLKEENPYFVPVDQWYSEDPYIDQKVRLVRLERICLAFHAHGISMGPFARWAIESAKAGNEKAVI